MKHLKWGLVCFSAGLGALYLHLPAVADDAAWYPSHYGAGDLIGAANNLSADGVVKAAKLVKKGTVHSLGHVTGPDTPVWGARKTQVIIVKSESGTTDPVGKNHITGHDDVVISHMGVGSQLDGLGHIGKDGLYYNGLDPKDFVRPTGLLKLGTESVPPMVTRGVLLDMTVLSNSKELAAGMAFNQTEIEQVLKKQGMSLRQGDVVIFHTGWAAKLDSDRKEFITRWPGLGVEGAKYLAAKGVVAVGADTMGVEVMPFEDPENIFPVHQELITKNGVYLLEFLNTQPLADENVHEFLFVLGHARIQGTVQMIINPLAIY